MKKWKRLVRTLPPVKAVIKDSSDAIEISPNLYSIKPLFGSLEDELGKNIMWDFNKF
ncbi:hypothetical protein [Paenibacillus qinlingensis]|uniref:hypothetical protein n=1 Tax=Paenibacillus qinlingensis TaxID=1837343 RepID=UPI0015644CA3|nr:hypothetical protein [Paenibacillus qinlingensis]NQX60577.1 hypothetical protein [Paenibacillus qinlingensis]